MDAKKLVELRKQAEKAVAEMPDGDLKVKAFEVILTHLLGGTTVAPGPSVRTEDESKSTGGKETTSTRSTKGRILVLQDEGFFKNQRTIGEVREELRAHGWHYPLTALSGPLMGLVQKRRLRRERATQGKKKIWKYSNP